MEAQGRRGWRWRERKELSMRVENEGVDAVCMRVEEEGSGGSVYESGGGGKWRQCV